MELQEFNLGLHGRSVLQRRATHDCIEVFAECCECSAIAAISLAAWLTARVACRALLHLDVCRHVCGVIITTNHKTDGIHLPADDRRHYVAWSDATKEDFTADYWTSLHRWYEDEGYQNVAAYLTQVHLAGFNAKAPPRATVAFHAIVDANRAPEDAELADTLDEIAKGGRGVTAVTIPMLVGAATGDFLPWLQDRKNRRVIPYRLESAGYVQVRNDAAQDGLWKITGKRQVIYARNDLSAADRVKAARQIVESGQCDQ
jgi:hypothetical protein